MQAAYVILHAVFDDSFLPGSFIDSQKRAHSLYPKLQAELARRRHLSAYNNSMRLSHFAPLLSSQESEDDLFSLPNWLWSRLEFIAPATWTQEMLDSLSLNSSVVAERLYNVTQQLLEDWKSGSSLLLVRPLQQEVEISQSIIPYDDSGGDDGIHNDYGSDVGGVDNDNNATTTTTSLVAIRTTSESTFPNYFMKGRLAFILSVMKNFSSLIKQVLQHYISYSSSFFRKFKKQKRATLN